MYSVIKTIETYNFEKTEIIVSINTIDMALAYMDHIRAPRIGDTWELVGSDSIYDSKHRLESFEYENTHNGDIKTITYMIVHD